jgi:hypothetical protein
MKERSVPIRPGIEEHLVRGAMSLCEFGIYALIHLQADYRTGIWRGSAPRILATAPRGASLRKIQRALEHFEVLGYLKSFRVQGARGNTAYLIDKFTVRSGALKGYRVNAAKSESWQRPVYEIVADDDTVPVAESVAEHDALSRSKKKEVREKKNPAAKPAPPADPRFQPFLAFSFGAFELKHGQRPTWTGRDFKALSAMLAGNKGLEPAELERRFRNYLASTEPFTQKQGDSLAYFCAHTDSFLGGPIMAVQRKGTNGKPSTSDNIETTLATLRGAEQIRPN